METGHLDDIRDPSPRPMQEPIDPSEKASRLIFLKSLDPSHLFPSLISVNNSLVTANVRTLSSYQIKQADDLPELR